MEHAFLRLTAIVFSFSILITSCSKEGDTGPQGEPGAQGDPGPAGPQGPKGADGTANVYYSDWLTVNFNTEVVDNDENVLGYQATIDAPKIVDSIMAKGAVLVYVNWGTAQEPSINALPLTDWIYGYWINYVVERGKIYLEASHPLSTTANPVTLQYRYVILPGGKSVNNSINWNDYGQVKMALKIDE